ncbi:MAG: sulfite exporter TauE/SafE family protein [Spirochaetia bacterium]|nr:sulfite exporter TauE/SafE family protein [Spirochaetia bacterium]
MEFSSIGIATAFAAGVVSFLSPCVLPLIPGYLSFVSGRRAADVREGTDRAGVFFRTLFFTLGFSAVFVILGLVFSGGGMLLAGNSARWLSIIAGAVIALFGLNMIFDFIKILNREARAHPTSKPAGAAGSFLVGMAFGAGWTPCIGPILASILLMAARSGTALAGASLLLLYSLGLAVPFLLAGLFFDKLTPLMGWFKKRGREIRLVSGILLIVIGLAMALGKLTALNGWFMRAAMGLKSMSVSNPALARAAGAGFWFVLAALTVLVPVLRKKRLLVWRRLVVIVGLLTLAVLDAAGITSTVDALAGWLLFQGA